MKEIRGKKTSLIRRLIADIARLCKQGFNFRAATKPIGGLEDDGSGRCDVDAVAAIAGRQPAAARHRGRSDRRSAGA
ncbi:hypothetical protein CHELA40_13610 [Chelatococcus asaccharovorans]|nr:hypothetical protein CHELA40_13610 [Chelatococcus asaccharovorans]